MGNYHKVLTIALAAASANNIALSQSNSGAVNLILNGATVTAGVAILDAPRQVLFTFAADETGHNYTVFGTNFNGQSISEVVAGTNTTAVTVNDFKTITRIAASASSTGAMTVGTNGVADSAPYIVDRFVATTNISAAVVVSGTISYSVQVSYDDFSPAWDLAANTPTWFPPPNTTNLTTQTTNKADSINMPISMIRLHQNSFSTGGTATLTVNVPFGST